MAAGGKWYFEVNCDNAIASGNGAILEAGIRLAFDNHNNYLGVNTDSWQYQNNFGATGEIRRQR